MNRAPLSSIPFGANFVVSETGHWGHPGTDLVFCLRDPKGQWSKTIVRAWGRREVGIASFYDATDNNIRNLAKRPSVTVVRGEPPK